MKPPVAVFTRQNPCTKFHIWQCFRGPKGFVSVEVAHAQSIIGANVPRVMEREGRLVLQNRRSVDYYVLTETGKEWLVKGMTSFVRNHPAVLPEVKFPLANW